MLSGPAAVTGSLPGRSSYGNSIDCDVYGKLFYFLSTWNDFLNCNLDH